MNDHREMSLVANITEGTQMWEIHNKYIYIDIFFNMNTVCMHHVVLGSKKLSFCGVHYRIHNDTYCTCMGTCIQMPFES